MSGARVLKRCGLAPIRLESAEGLALVNGTQVMTAIGALAVYDALQLSRLIDIAAAMSLEVLMGSRTEFNPRIDRVRPHPGQAAAADNMSASFRTARSSPRTRTASAFRTPIPWCSPQVHGATKDALAYARKVIETEMNSSTNNPLTFADQQDFLLGGNFHGQPVGSPSIFSA